MLVLRTVLANLPRRSVWLALALLLAAPALRAGDLQDAARSLRAGQTQQALVQINKALAAKPNDAQARFVKGTILAELGDSKEATDIFLKLTQDYPELPEPYNNLAVLYAAHGQYEKARAALEKSLHTHPSYATAYENLTEIYAKLANQAYDKALQLDTAASSPKNERLALVQELAPVAVAPRAAEPLTVAAASTPTIVTDVAPINSVAAASPAAEQRAAPAGPAAQPPAVAASRAEKTVVQDETVVAAARPAAPAPRIVQAPPQQVMSPKRSAVPQRTASASSPQSEVVDTVRAWAAAWSRKDASAYLAFYAKQFKPPRGEPRAHWEQARRSRIIAPKSISVIIQSPRVEVRGNSSASVRFRQTYRSDVFSGNSTKTLTLVKSDGRWLITGESVN